MTAPDDYTAQLLASLQAWRQYLEQAMGVLAPGLAAAAVPPPSSGVGDRPRPPAAAAVRQPNPASSSPQGVDHAPPAGAAGTCGSAFSWVASASTPAPAAAAPQRSLYASFAENRSIAADDQAWRPQRVPPPPPAARPPVSDPDFEIAGNCNPVN